MTSAENRRSALARQAYGESRLASVTASAMPSIVERRNPVTPSTTISGAAPSGLAMTGVPHAMDSVITMPNGSGQSIGKTMA